MTARQTINQAANRAWVPPPDLSVSEWSEKNVWLGGDSPERGHYRVARTPYAKGIMDCLSPSHPAKDIVLEKGSQTGGTRIGLNWMGYIIDQNPAPTIVTLPSEGVAKEWSNQRLTQLVDDTPALAGKITDTKRKGTGNTTYLKKIAGTAATIKIAWSTSAKKMRSTPAANKFSDEVDGFVGDAEGEGDPLFLLSRRSTNFPNGKHFMVSTPTLEPSRIHREFLKGDQRYYFVPCPLCGHFQRFVFAQFRWPKRVEGESATEAASRRAQVYYECRECGGHVTERYKTRMLAEGTWLACAGRPDLMENGFSPAERITLEPIFRQMSKSLSASFHLPAYYSPMGWYGWEDLVKDWELAQGDTRVLKGIVNTVFAEAWKEKGDAPDPRRLSDRRESYEIGVVPKGGLLLVGAADIQADRIEFELVAFGRRNQRWSVYYEVIQPMRRNLKNELIPCRTSEPEPWERFAELIAYAWPVEGGGTLPIRAVGVDTGFNADPVYDFCRRYPQPLHGPTGSFVLSDRTVVPLKGGHSFTKLLEAVSTVDAARKRRGLRIVTIGSSYAKQCIYDALRLDKPVDNGEYPVGYYHYPDYTFDFFQGLTAESRHVTAKGSVEWRKDSPRNEPLDLAGYSLAVGYLCGMDRFQEHDWAGIELRLGRSRQPAPRFSESLTDRPAHASTPAAPRIMGRMTL